MESAQEEAQPSRFAAGRRPGGVDWIILGAGFLLIFVDLGRKSLWCDEIINDYVTNGSVGNVLRQCGGAKGLCFYPPLNPLLILLAKQISNTDFMIRLPSALCGFALLLTLRLWAKEVSSKELARCVTFLCVLNPFFIYYAQDAKMYIQSALCAALALLALSRILRSRGEHLCEHFVFLATVHVAHVYLLYFGWIAVGVLFCAFFPLLLGRTAREAGQRGRKAVYFLLAHVYVAAAYVPWLPELRGTIARHAGAESVPVAVGRLSAGILLRLSGGGVAGLVVLGFAVTGLIFLGRRQRLPLACGLAAAVFSIGSVFLSKPKQPVLARYFAFLFPLLILAAGTGFIQVRRWLGRLVPRPGLVGWGLPAGVVLVSSGAVLVPYYAGEKGAWKGACRYIAENLPADTMILGGIDFSNASLERYLVRTHPEMKKRKAGPFFHPGRFRSFTRTHPNVWYVTHDWPGHAPDLRTAVEESFDFLQRFRGQSEVYDVLIFERKANLPVAPMARFIVSDDPQWPAKPSLRIPLQEPVGIDVGQDGVVYITDMKGNCVVALSPSGEELHRWGLEGSGPGEFKSPAGIAVAPDGSVLVADMWNGRVQIFGPSGEFLRSIGRQGPIEGGISGGFYGPRSVTTTDDGDIYVVDTGHCSISRFEWPGKLVQEWGKQGSGPGEFSEPVGIAAWGGIVAVADTRNQRIQTFSPSGDFQGSLPVNGWQDDWTAPYMTTMVDGRILASDSREGQIYLVDLVDREVASLPAPRPEGLGSPKGLAVAPDGALYVTDSDSGRVRKLLLTPSQDD